MRPTSLPFATFAGLLAAALTAGCTPTATTSAPAPATSPATPTTPAASASVQAATPAMATAPAAASASGAPMAAAPGASAVAGGDPLVGQVAPDFTTNVQDGSSVHIAALKGKPVVLYFYPKDETPGCTKEACSFRDSWAALSKTGAVLVGVSADTLASHKQFVDHWKLPFLLASDPQGAIGKQYGVPFEGYHQRQTVVIGKDGTIKKVYRSVDVTKHAQEILDDLTHLS